jgi:hypothetical protein
VTRVVTTAGGDCRLPGDCRLLADDTDLYGHAAPGATGVGRTDTAGSATTTPATDDTIMTTTTTTTTETHHATTTTHRTRRTADAGTDLDSGGGPDAA